MTEDFAVFHSVGDSEMANAESTLAHVMDAAVIKSPVTRLVAKPTHGAEVKEVRHGSEYRPPT